MRGIQLRIFVVLILLLANIALGWLYISQSIEDTRESLRRQADLAAVFEKNGVALADGFTWPGLSAHRLIYQRDEDKEKILATALLGECRRYDGDGGIIRYINSTGSFAFRQDGSWEARWQAETPVSIQSLIQLLGLENVYEQTETTVSQAFDGIRVADSGLVLLHDGDGFVRLSGLWYPGEPSAVYGTQTRSAETCLLFSLSTAPGFSRIDSAELIYAAEAMTWHLIPVWRFSTDTGDIWLDAVTGEQRLILRGEYF
jgi:hypothetical protein